jgi:uncharacterized protein
MTKVFDADSHVMEVDEWLPTFADPQDRPLIQPLGLANAGARARELMATLPALWERQRSETITADVIAGPKGWSAPGALDAEVRSRVLDALGIDRQLVFPTFSLGQFARSSDLDTVYAGTRALNRAMVAFCAHDDRLLPIGYLPLHDPDRTVAELEHALQAGVAAVWIPSDAPGDISPAHLAYEPVWARLAEAGVPFVLHVGGGKLLPAPYHANGHPRPTDWLGGGENMRAKDFPVLHHSPERFLACLTLDGVFHRHPGLRGAAVELGASWVPGMLRNLDHAQRSFAKFEPLVQQLDMKPSEYLRRQVRFTPFPFEDTAWLVEQCGPQMLLFSTDYPHPEGGRRPFEVFGEALAGFDDATRERFFWRNGAELFGPGRPRYRGRAMVDPEAIPKVELTDAAVDALRDDILTGRRAVGAALPSERELAAQFDLNRTTVREALHQLELLGLVERHHGKRSRVADFRRTGSLKLLPHLARLKVRGADASIRESAAIVYEGAAALRDLEAAVEAGSDADIVQADREFHHVVTSLSASVALELMVNDFYRALDGAYDRSGTTKRAIAMGLRALVEAGGRLPQRSLAAAIEAGDADAARRRAARMLLGFRPPRHG